MFRKNMKNLETRQESGKNANIEKRQDIRKNPENIKIPEKCSKPGKA